MGLLDVVNELAAYLRHLSEAEHAREIEPEGATPQPQPSSGWKQSAAHPTRAEWMQPAETPTFQVVRVTRSPSGTPVYITRDSDGRITDMVPAGKNNRANLHPKGFQESLARLTYGPGGKK